MFYYKTSFSKKAVFLDKTVKNHLWEDKIVLKGGMFGHKSQHNLFCRHHSFEYFSLNNFFEKTIFSKINPKNNFCVHDHFWGKGRQMTKMNITFFFFFWKWGTKYSFQVFWSETSLVSLGVKLFHSRCCRLHSIRLLTPWTGCSFLI